MERRLNLFLEAFTKIERLMGKTLGEAANAIAELHRERRADIERAGVAVNELVGRAMHIRAFILKWAVVGSLCGLALFLSGFAVGLRLFER